MADAVFDFLSYNNGYLPETTGQVVGMVRDPKKNRLNEYVQYVYSPKTTAYWTRLEQDAFKKLKAEGETVWADGDARPVDNLNRLRHRMLSIDLVRHDHSWALGYMAIRQTNLYKVKPAHMLLALSQAMNRRYKSVYTEVEDTAKWGTASTAAATATSISGGGHFWHTGTKIAPYFSTGLLNISKIILDNSAGVVETTDLMCILSVADAIKIGQSEEIRSWYANSSLADKVTANPFGNVNRMWGLPDVYSGFRLMVEPKQYIQDGIAGVTPTDGAPPSYFKQANTAIILARVGGIDGVPGEMPFSTLQMFYYGKQDQKSASQDHQVTGPDAMMDVNVFDDSQNERVKGHVTHMFASKLVAPETGFYVTGVTS